MRVAAALDMYQMFRKGVFFSVAKEHFRTHTNLTMQVNKDVTSLSVEWNDPGRTAFTCIFNTRCSTSKKAKKEEKRNIRRDDDILEFVLRARHIGLCIQEAPSRIT